MIRGWQLGTLLREGRRNVVANVGRSIALMTLAVAAVAAITAAELTTTSRILEFQQRFARDGGYVLVAGTHDAGISAARCEALNQHAWVTASGSISNLGPIEVSHAPGTLYQSHRATVGALRVWDVGVVRSADLSDGLVVGTSAATELGLRPGSRITLDATPLRVGAVAAFTHRNPSIDRGIVIVAPPNGAADACWIEVLPGTEVAATDVVTTELTTGDAPVDVRPYRELDDYARDPLSELTQRPQAHAWAVIGALLVVVGWLGLWTRRSEIGLYRALGTTAPALVVMTAVETLLTTLPAAIAGLLWTVATIAATSQPPETQQVLIALRSVGSTVLVALTGVPLSTLWLGRGQIADQLKDR